MKQQYFQRTLSLVRNNVVDTSQSQHLGQIIEEGDLYLIDDLGAEHEESSQDDFEDEDEILIVDKKRHIGSVFQHQDRLKGGIPDDYGNEDEDEVSFFSRIRNQ